MAQPAAGRARATSAATAHTEAVRDTVDATEDAAEAQERLERARRVRDNLTQVREQQSEPESGGEADVIKISPTETGPGADPPLIPGQQEAEPLKAGDENRAR